MRPVHLPDDELPHRDLIEWWYFHGHLQTPKKRKFNFMTCFFKINLGHTRMIKYVPHAFLRWFFPLVRGRIVHAHLVDFKNKKYLTHYHHMGGKIHLHKYEGEKKLDLHYQCAQLKEPIKFDFNLALDTGNFGWQLDLKNNKPALMEGPHNQGFLDFGTVRSSYYYTLTNLDVCGSVMVHGQKLPVQGKGWMDHQWGNFDLLGAKWVWFGIQLDNNTEYMLFKLSFKEKKKLHKMINVSRPDGSQKTIYNYTLEPLAFWTSPQTGQTYGIEWALKFKDPKPIKLIIKSSLPNQEMYDDQTAPYYEGDCEVTGTVGGKKVKGKAFLEIVDYQKKWLEKYLHLKIKKKL